jgi:hypothetical protein
MYNSDKHKQQIQMQATADSSSPDNDQQPTVETTDIYLTFT